MNQKNCRGIIEKSFVNLKKFSNKIQYKLPSFYTGSSKGRVRDKGLRKRRKKVPFYSTFGGSLQCFFFPPITC